MGKLPTPRRKGWGPLSPRSANYSLYFHRPWIFLQILHEGITVVLQENGEDVSHFKGQNMKHPWCHKQKDRFPAKDCSQEAHCRDRIRITHHLIFWEKSVNSSERELAHREDNVSRKQVKDEKFVSIPFCRLKMVLHETLTAVPCHSPNTLPLQLRK